MEKGARPQSAKNASKGEGFIVELANSFQSLSEEKLWHVSEEDVGGLEESGLGVGVRCTEAAEDAAEVAAFSTGAAAADRATHTSSDN